VSLLKILTGERTLGEIFMLIVVRERIPWRLIIILSVVLAQKFAR
jgi:hypothetical protein